jgi:hypothetical protein
VPVDRVRAVDRFQHGGQPGREVLSFGQQERDTGGADPPLGPHQSLRHDGRLDRERCGDRCGLDAEHGLQHQRRAHVGCDGGMGTDEHELEPAVRNRSHIGFESLGGRMAFAEWFGHPVRRRLPHVAQPVARHGQQPPLRVGGHTVDGPPRHGAFQGVGERVLGGGDVAGGRGQYREQSAVVVPGDLGHPGPGLYGVYHPRSAL